MKINKKTGYKDGVFYYHLYLFSVEEYSKIIRCMV